ncbi:hypothetical protein [Mycobacterium asiaticum]|uniref:Uncharacterized protein n=1 Tax=Mycobacterium asiaticum TaxID=1790 RepID=A0A1A3HQ18_MYCAS|nr:hypothetical protein [Mycobacterium asiaticum]OBJ49754.1 hypothetical protein A9W94_29320 [Mycobacterium asiaticum]OBJ87661.1 hypothetical protein A5640_06820 [Mycobacterium asiaticum]ORA13346.1 hypothetical protein BST16_14440 [Mycobacterium asiaticum DSM 44297]
MTGSGLYGFLTVVSLVLMLIAASFAAVYVRRLSKQPTTAVSEEPGSARVVVQKFRHREPMSQDEWEYATRVITNRGSLLALSIPGMVFLLGCFFVFGSLEHLHGATPSERTFLGVIPMLTSTNLALRMLGSARLKRRLKKAGR